MLWVSIKELVPTIYFSSRLCFLYILGPIPKILFCWKHLNEVYKRVKNIVKTCFFSIVSVRAKLGEQTFYFLRIHL